MIIDQCYVIHRETEAPFGGKTQTWWHKTGAGVSGHLPSSGLNIRGVGTNGGEMLRYGEQAAREE